MNEIDQEGVEHYILEKKQSWTMFKDAQLSINRFFFCIYIGAISSKKKCGHGRVT